MITINDHIIIDYMNDNDWNEIHHHQIQTKQRRRLWGKVGKWFRKVGRKIKNWFLVTFGKVALPPPQKSHYWNKEWVTKRRYIGYFPGYRNQKGYPYKKAEKYCNENYGGLATILSKK